MKRRAIINHDADGAETEDVALATRSQSKSVMKMENDCDSLQTKYTITNITSESEPKMKKRRTINHNMEDAGAKEVAIVTISQPTPVMKVENDCVSSQTNYGDRNQTWNTQQC